ncbi:C40 family peptidase [Desulforhopalus sp. 52FAK]
MITTATINVGVSSHYQEPSYASELTTQGLLGEEVKVIDHQPLFSQIIQNDGYTSWISTDQLSFLPQSSHPAYMVTSHFIAIHKEASPGSDKIRDGVIGSTLHIIDATDDWFRVVLPDGLCGWVLRKDLGSQKEFTAENLTRQARDFLGYQYTWGGKSPKGFDCSGLVQTIFTLCSYQLPRNSSQQHEHHFFSNDHSEARAGDLFFFGKTTDRVSHVGLATGNGRFIHASGWVRENSLNIKDSDFSQHHLDTFISVNRYS